VAGTRGSRHTPEPGVTLEDVGRLAGVSAATVSRVVNNNPRVSPEIRVAVNQAIERLGYVPNRAARSLMTRRTDSIGVVIRETAGRLFGDPYFGQLMLGISEEASAAERQLVLLTAPTSEVATRVEQYVMARHVDGVIVVGPHGGDQLPARLARRRIPVVVNDHPTDETRVSYVDSDNLAGARLAVEHLVACGRRRIATIHGTLDLASGADRLTGYREAIATAGLPADPTLEADGDFSQVRARQAMQELLARRPDLDAVFVASDSMAAAALRVLRDGGCRIPEDVAVVGFDDTPVATETSPTLTTVRQPIEAMGRTMVRQLLRQIDHPDEPAQRIVFATELVIRESSPSPVGSPSAAP
jgi:DNA-binding LacI/PurR family transcriptional regulator